MATSLGRWLLSEASSGTAVTTAVDDEGSNDLTITWSGADEWTSNSAGNGLGFAAHSHSSVATNADFPQLLEGLNKVTILFTCDDLLGTSDRSRVIFVGTSGGNGEVGVCIDNVRRPQVRWIYDDDSNNGTITFETMPSGSYYVVCVEIDTTEPVETDRFRVYVNNVPQLPTYDHRGYPGENSTLPADLSGTTLTIGNRGDLTRGAGGGIHYVEIFSGLLTTQERADAYSALSNDSDSNWAAGDPPPVFTVGPAAGDIGSDTADAEATITHSTNLDHYYGIWPRGYNPTNTEVKAETGAVQAGSLINHAAGAVDETLTPLLADTNYDLEWLAEETGGAGPSARASTYPFNTTALPTYSNVVLGSFVAQISLSTPTHSTAATLATFACASSTTGGTIYAAIREDRAWQTDEMAVIEAGVDPAIVWSDNQAGTTTPEFTDVTINTGVRQYLGWVHKSAAAEYSNVLNDDFVSYISVDLHLEIGEIKRSSDGSIGVSYPEGRKPPESAQGLARTSSTTSSITCAFTYNSSGQEGFEVKYKRSVDSVWITEPELLPTATDFVIYGLTSGTTYDIEVRAFAEVP